MPFNWTRNFSSLFPVNYYQEGLSNVILKFCSSIILLQHVDMVNYRSIFLNVKVFWHSWHEPNLIIMFSSILYIAGFNVIIFYLGFLLLCF